MFTVPQTLLRRAVVSAALAVWCPGEPAQAQSVPPRVAESVVVTGSAQPVTFRELPRTVRVITREDIERLPARTVTDLVRLVASVDVRARGPRGVQADFAVRGAGFGQVLVLVDGVRMNNAQTGHHNADLPVTLDEIERVEVLLGPGSSAFGADAFGGTINLITRRGSQPPSFSVVAGEHRFVDVVSGLSIGTHQVDERLSSQVTESSGFMFDREFSTVTISSRTRIGEGTQAAVAFVDKEFGANGFYGASPSKEWTTLWSASLEHRLVKRDRVEVSARASYRTHHDRFLWDVTRPGFFENTHRTHAAEAGVRVRWRVADGTDIAASAETAGDWIRSSNLGDHRLTRGAAAVDVQRRLDDVTSVQGAVRVDTYSTFGRAVSPSLGVSRWLTPVWRVRASGGRAFRVPTFTERYYRDPAHAARADLAPERAWAVDAAADWLPSEDWQGTAGVFHRWERGVIDWVRPTAADLWRTTNIRDVSAGGVELGLKRTLDERASFGVDYTWLSVDSDALGLLSKYTLDYARHSVVVSGGLQLPGAIDAGLRLEGRERIGRDPYALLDLRVSRQAGRLRVFVDAANVLGTGYEEIRGVPMPGRWVTVGIEAGR